MEAVMYLFRSYKPKTVLYFPVKLILSFFLTIVFLLWRLKLLGVLQEHFIVALDIVMFSRLSS